MGDWHRKSQKWEGDRTYVGLIVKMAHYVDLATKNKITLTLETDQIVQTTFYFPLPPTFSRLQDHQIPDLWLCDHRTQLQAKN